MTRRELLMSVIAARLAVPLRSTFGYVDVQRAIDCGWFPARVYLDGVEVQECVRLNDREGWVEAHVLNADGKAQLNAPRDGVLVERRFGRVRFVPDYPRKLSK